MYQKVAKCQLIAVFMLVTTVFTIPLYDEYGHHAGHDVYDTDTTPPPTGTMDWISPPGEGPETDWVSVAQNSMQGVLEWTSRVQELTKPAENVVFMMGDGLGVSTSSAARIYQAQLRSQPGDDVALSWENLPFTALVKTYATDVTVADSANTATALLCGEKCNFGVVCANQRVVYGNCSSWVGNSLSSVMREAMRAGKWAGVVTTTAVTHASPACAYASTPTRSWEANVPASEESVGCTDIASQLVLDELNSNIRVILGGGRGNFMPISESDPEYPARRGLRLDGQNLVEAWLQDKADKGLDPDLYRYVMNSSTFDEVDPETTEYLFGLFEPNHMHFDLDRNDPEINAWGEPSLAEMVEKAIGILQKSPNGYFLFVEGGRIDHGHHMGSAQLALNETLGLSDAVQVAMDMTSENNTLLVLTSDHSHTLSISGYPARDVPIFTFDSSYQPTTGTDRKPYGVLSYANGPGFYFHRKEGGGIASPEVPRMNLTGMEDDMNDPEYLQDAGVPLSLETHAGEDVMVHARGPMAHMMIGSQQQNYVAHVMKYALCVGDYENNCPGAAPQTP